MTFMKLNKSIGLVLSKLTRKRSIIIFGPLLSTLNNPTYEYLSEPYYLEHISKAWFLLVGSVIQLISKRNIKISALQAISALVLRPTTKFIDRQASDCSKFEPYDTILSSSIVWSLFLKEILAGCVAIR